MCGVGGGGLLILDNFIYIGNRQKQIGLPLIELPLELNELYEVYNIMLNVISRQTRETINVAIHNTVLTFLSQIIWIGKKLEIIEVQISRLHIPQKR